MVATKRSVTKAKAGQNGSPSPIKRLRRTVRITCYAEPVDGDAPIWAEIVSLSFDEIESLNARFVDGITYDATWDLIAPYVIRWNCTKFDFESGAIQDVPPPSEWGAKAFRAVEPWITDWLAFELRRIQVVPDFLVGWAKRNATPAGDAAAT